MPAALLPFASATEQVAALRAGALSSVELLERQRTRVRHFNPTLNVIVALDEERARAAAHAADRALQRGVAGPLAGLPITIKDSLDVAGLATTAGLPERAGVFARADAPTVAALRAAGAVIIGKTNVPTLLGDWQSDNPLFGRTNNPWDVTRTAGGSSGGAAAVAAGLCALDLGSDMYGSIRLPASFCGVYGHKPSETAFPRTGQFPGTAVPNPALAFAVHGPLARSAADLELALDVLAAPEADEAVAWRVTLPPARHEALSEFRVGVLARHPDLPVDDEVAGTLDDLANRLSLTGAIVRRVWPDALADLAEHHRVFATLLGAMHGARSSPAERAELAQATAARRGPFATAYAAGCTLSAADYLLLMERRAQYQAAWRAFFHDWDVLLLPTSPTVAFPHTDAPPATRTLAVNGQAIAYDEQSRHPSFASLSGLPATAFPVGLSRAGLPLGLQAIGPYLEDRTPIRLAALIAQRWGGFTPPPGYDKDAP